MTIGGWIIMTASLVFVTVFFGSMLFLVLRRRPDVEHLHSTLDETPDMNEESDCNGFDLSSAHAVKKGRCEHR